MKQKTTARGAEKGRAVKSGSKQDLSLANRTKPKATQAAQQRADAPSRAKVKEGHFLGVKLTTREAIERTTYARRSGTSRAANA
jgi:hypothetical protein